MKVHRWKIVGVMFFAVLVVLMVNLLRNDHTLRENPPDGSLQMTAVQVEDLVVGKSWLYPRNDGGVYFNPNGTADTEWKGKRNPGIWYMKGEEICIDVEDWGGAWCYIFHQRDHEIFTWATTQSRYIPVYIKDGNRFGI